MRKGENCTLVVLNRTGINISAQRTGDSSAVDAVFHMKGAVVADKVIGKTAALIAYMAVVLCFQ